MAEDLLQGVKDALQDDQLSEADPQATMEQLLKAIEGMEGISDEEKKNMVQNLVSGLFGGTGSKASELPIGGVISNPWLEFTILLGMISFIGLALGLLGYKLYNNMLKREKSRELKKIKKEQKKRK